MIVTTRPWGWTAAQGQRWQFVVILEPKDTKTNCQIEHHSPNSFSSENEAREAGQKYKAENLK